MLELFTNTSSQVWNASFLCVCFKGFDVWDLPIQNFVQGAQRPVTKNRSKMQAG